MTEPTATLKQIVPAVSKNQKKKKKKTHSKPTPIPPYPRPAVSPTGSKNSTVFSTIDLAKELVHCEDQAEEDPVLAQLYGDELCFMVKQLTTTEPKPGLDFMPYCM